MRISLLIFFFVASSVVVPESDAAEGFFGASIGTSETVDLGETITSFKLTAGGSINQHLDSELAFTNHGYMEFGNIEIKQYALAYSLMPKYNFGRDLSLFARMGVATWVYEYDTTTFEYQDSGFDEVIGVGLNLRISRYSSIVMEYEAYDIAEGDVYQFTIGYRWWYENLPDLTTRH